MKSRYKKIKSQGDAGEAIVATWLAKEGKNVVMSENKFDSEKDMTVDGKKVEIKTQVPFVFQNAFSIREKQLKKCLGADEVYFVSVPTVKHHYSEGRVYMTVGKKMKYREYTTKDGRNMILIPIKSLQEVFEMTEDEKMLLSEYSVSGWKNE